MSKRSYKLQATAGTYLSSSTGCFSTGGVRQHISSFNYKHMILMTSTSISSSSFTCTGGFLNYRLAILVSVHGSAVVIGSIGVLNNNVLTGYNSFAVREDDHILITVNGYADRTLESFFYNKFYGYEFTGRIDSIINAGNSVRHLSGSFNQNVFCGFFAQKVISSKIYVAIFRQYGGESIRIIIDIKCENPTHQTSIFGDHYTDLNAIARLQNAELFRHGSGGCNLHFHLEGISIILSGYVYNSANNSQSNNQKYH